MSVLFLEFQKCNASAQINFSPFSDQDGLPFPLYLHPIWKIIFSLTLLFTLIEGTRLRKIIIDFISSPESKLGPINYLIWVDQINSFFLGINLLFRVVFFLSPEPIGILIGREVCDFTEFSILIYLAGSSIWGSYIALFRVMFIRAQTWLTNSIGIKNLLWLLLSIGTGQIFYFAIVTLFVDEESYAKKVCHHLSFDDVIIMQEYRVNLNKN